MNPIEPKDQASMQDLIRTRLDRLEDLEVDLKMLTKEKTTTAAQKVAINQYAARIANLENLNSHKKPYKAFLGGKNRNILKPRIELDWGGKLSEDQMQKLISAEIEKQIAYQVICFYEKELSIIEETYTNLLSMHSVSVASRLKGRKKNVDKNREILQQCITKLKSLKAGKRLKSIDYVEFKGIANSTEFKPAYIPSPRIAKSKRELPPPTRSDNWPDSTLRKFFKEETKLDPTTKKGKS